MERHLFLFKRIAAQVAHQEGFSMRAFINDRGLDDFVEEAAQNGYVPAEVAARALETFCMEEGRFNGFMVGLKTALGFLDEILSGPRDKQKCFTDLRQIMAEGGRWEQFLKWVNGYYK
jgi:hypothetical protein